MVPDARIEFAEQELMRRREDDQVSDRPEQQRRAGEFFSIGIDVFQYIDVEN